MRHQKDNHKFLESGLITEEAMAAFLNNELTPDEKQKFEKLLRNDPFAQDALEGMQTLSDYSAGEASVREINKKVRERSGMHEGKRLKLNWTVYAYAAVLIGLLIGIGFVLVTFIGNNTGQLAMETAKKADVINQKVDEPNLVAPAESTINDSSVQTLAPTVEPLTKPAADIYLPGKDLLEKKSQTTTNELTAVGQGTVGSKAANQTTGADVLVSEPVVASPTPAAGLEAKPSANKDVAAVSSADDKAAKEEIARLAVQNNRAAEQASKTVQPESKAALQRVDRGAITESEIVDNKTVVTIDDAMKSFNGGNYKKASEQFDAILQLQPQNANALYFGGISDYINGNLKKGEKSFDKLLKDGTRFMDGSKWYKANILLQKGKRDEAKKLLDELAESGGSYKERAVKKKADAGF